MAIVKIEDRVSNIEMAVFSEVYEDARPLLIKDQLLIVDGEVSVDEFTGGLRLSARRILDLAMARNEYAKYLCIHAIDQSQVTHTIGELKALLQRFRHGNCRVLLTYQNATGRARMLLGEEWMVNPTDELVNMLNKLYGDNTVFIVYR